MGFFNIFVTTYADGVRLRGNSRLRCKELQIHSAGKAEERYTA
jgi:hypothetical protein